MTDAQIISFPRARKLNGPVPRRSFIDVGDHRFAFAEHGSGRDVVLLHGMLTSLDDMMLGLGNALSHHHHVVAFDRPGHGGSSRPRFAGSLPTQAALIVAGMKALGLCDSIIVGHSNGGALELTLATRYPGEVAGIVALAPLVFAEPRLEIVLFGPRGITGLGHLAAYTSTRPADAALLPILWNAMFLPQAMPEAFADALPFGALSTAEEMIATGEDSLAMGLDLMCNTLLYPGCRVPVRVMGGSSDIVVNNRMQGALLPRFMPDCTYERVEGIGHMLQHFVPDRVAAVVEQLVGEGTRRTRASVTS